MRRSGRSKLSSKPYPDNLLQSLDYTQIHCARDGPSSMPLQFDKRLDVDSIETI